MPKIWVLLGRTGDLLSILPLLWKDAQSGERQKLMVAAEYAPVLEGVSYVEPVIYDGPHYDISKAVAQAKSSGHDVLCVQVNGPADETLEHTYRPAGLQHAVTTSYQKEMWRVAGRLSEWDETYPLVFDRRSSERESKLIEMWHSKKPVILVSRNGNSSPFSYGDLLLELIRLKFGKTHLVLELPKAERIYDLLALYEKANCLVAVDSAPLHLARACPNLPVIALTNDRPSLWQGSSWEPNWVWCCRYHDFPGRAVEMLTAIRTCRDGSPSPFVKVWNAYDSKPTRFTMRELPILQGACGRDSTHAIKDSVRVAYLKDCLRMGLQRSAGGYVVITRPETISNLEGFKGEAGFAYRMTGSNADKSFTPIVDLFCATKAWWKARLPEIPDLLFGKDFYWSQALWALFKKHGATDVTGTCHREPSTTKTVTDPVAPRIVHNRDLCAAYVKSSGVHSRYPKVSEQAYVVPLDMSALPPFAYNPSMAKSGGKTWLTFRYHFAPSDFRTRLGIAQIINDKVSEFKELTPGGASVEDARLFLFHGGLWMSWVEAEFDSVGNAKSIVKYAALQDGSLRPGGRVCQVKVKSNDGSAMEKNWCFFESNENLLCVYRAHLDHTVLQIQGETIIHEYKTPQLHWPYGKIRGGNVVPHGDKFLRFFHSRTDTGIGTIEPRYYVGACLMNAHPPFDVVAISRKPILYGSELPNADCFHFKPNVVFPCGAVADGDGWLVACGINDSSCALVRVTPDMLNLWTNS